jgi:hypothetical protein
MSARRAAQHAVAALVAVLFAITVAVDAAPASAQETPLVEVRVAFEPPSVRVGERTSLVVSVLHGPNLLISATDPRLVGGLELIEAVPSETTTTREGLITTFRYVVTSFALGELQPGALRVSWLMEDGSGGSVTAPSPTLAIGTSVSSADGTLRPLKPQASIGGAAPAWQRPISAGGGRARARGGGAARFWVHRRERVQEEDRRLDTPPSGPEERARARLTGLTTAQLLPDGDFDGFYGGISTIVRGYLEERFDFRAMAMTTVELQRRMEDRGVERWQARLVAGLLDRCDAAVYAHRNPDPASADHDLTVAFEIVELSRPPALVAPA